MEHIRRLVAGLAAGVSGRAAFDLALRLTLVDLVLHPVGDGRIRPFVMILAAAGLVLPGQLRSAWIWLPLTLLTAARVLMSWPLPDNHAYLLSYWCLAITLALALPNPAATLARNGRWMIGLVFAFATLWKLVLSPDYLDTTFFRVTLLTDPRFGGLVQLLGGITPEALEDSRLALTRHADVPAFTAQVPALPGRVLQLARFATGWTAGLEGCVALCFLWPWPGRVRRCRDGLLLVFCASAYAAAPVEGFGWLLVAMGVAQSDEDRAGTRLLYLAVFALILFYREVPWALLLAERIAAS